MLRDESKKVNAPALFWTLITYYLIYAVTLTVWGQVHPKLTALTYMLFLPITIFTGLYVLLYARTLGRYAVILGLIVITTLYAPMLVSVQEATARMKFDLHRDAFEETITSIYLNEAPTPRKIKQAGCRSYYTPESTPYLALGKKLHICKTGIFFPQIEALSYTGSIIYSPSKCRSAEKIEHCYFDCESRCIAPNWYWSG